MRYRGIEYGDKNLIGARVEELRKASGMKQKDLLAQLQIKGIDLSPSGLSKLEGQVRSVTDIELYALAEVLNVDVYWLMTGFNYEEIKKKRKKKNIITKDNEPQQ